MANNCAHEYNKYVDLGYERIIVVAHGGVIRRYTGVGLICIGMNLGTPSKPFEAYLFLSNKLIQVSPFIINEISPGSNSN